MAMTTRATTPSHSDPFHEANPRATASISPGTVPATLATGAVDQSSFLDPHNPQKGIPSTAGLSPGQDKARLSPGRAAALTGAAAMAEMKRRKMQTTTLPSRQTSPNPAVTAMQDLMGQGGMSKPSNAPAPDKLSEPLRKAAEKIRIPDDNNDALVDTNPDERVSPVSIGSFGTIESSATGSAMTATANDENSTPGQQFVAEPAQMGESDPYPGNNGGLAVPDQEGNKNVSFSYPGPPPQQVDQQEGGPSRGMSLPGYGQGSPKSPASGKRHKCPYCSTDFTRHHNLKSHLLTHSQEKPYVCQTCQARFRRLHDLKRHTKLHTGERPHTCDKCGRRFARGDALARHNKGPGGCAGRRSSFGGDDDYDGQGPDGMDGVEYDDDDGTDDNGRRGSEPSRKRQHLATPQDSNREVYRQHSSTYPPAPTRSMRGAMGPPQVVHPGPSTATSPRDMAAGQQPSPGGSSMGTAYYGTGQVFAEPGMLTHSPKPLSPGHPPDQHRLSVGDASTGLSRNRATSLTAQFQQQHFGRGSVGGRTPPPSNAHFQQGQVGPHNTLPPLGSNAQSQAPRTLQPSSMQTGSIPNIHGHVQPQGPPLQGSNPSSLSSHGRSSGSSIRDMQQDPNDIWGYVRSLESRFSRMQDEYELRISRLQEELINVKGQLGQLSNAASYTSDMGRQGPY